MYLKITKEKNDLNISTSNKKKKFINFFKARDHGWIFLLIVSSFYHKTSELSTDKSPWEGRIPQTTGRNALNYDQEGVHFLVWRANLPFQLNIFWLNVANMLKYAKNSIYRQLSTKSLHQKQEQSKGFNCSSTKSD